jgi:hypothetical protein
VVPDVSRRTRLTLPDLASEQDKVADKTARRARVAGPPMPKMQGTQRRPSRTPSGREACHARTARLRPGRHEVISGDPVWQELERRGAAIAVVPFIGRRGPGHTDRIVLSRIDGDELVDVERWTGRHELCYALETPVRDRPAHSLANRRSQGR